VSRLQSLGLAIAVGMVTYRLARKLSSPREETSAALAD
jgi:hypothetical protein